jgi:hypothetical protein
MIGDFGRDLAVVVPAGVEILQENRFYKCLTLMSITFEVGSRLRTVGGESLFACSALRRSVIPGSVETIGCSAFANCECLELCEFERPSALARIEMRAFQSCFSMVSFEFPARLESLGAECFTACWNLSRLGFDSGSSLERVVGDFAFDDFLFEVGIDVLMGELEVEVRDGEFRDIPGWIREGGSGSAARYVPEYER